MNAVNLLPAKHRPRTPTGGQQGSSYAVIGVLGGLLLMVLLYALTVNGINSSKESVARTKAETAQAKKRAEQLTPYGNFIQVKEQRVSSVKQLATGRIDWERLALGLAHVLPEDVWLISANASATGQGGNGSASPSTSGPAPSTGAAPGGGSGASSTPPAGGDSGAGAKPTMVLSGCAVSHSQVAVTLVRLRHLPAVDEVDLSTITKPENTTTGPATSAPGGNTNAGGTSDCGPVKRKATYKFEATVTFKPQPGSTPEQKKVPARLGGGA